MNYWRGKYFSKVMKSKQYADCTFIIETPIGRKTYECHRLIMSCSSEVFERMLNESNREFYSWEVRLSDVEPNVFERFCELAYGHLDKNTIHLDFDTIVKLTKFSKKYLVKAFQEHFIQQAFYLAHESDTDQLLRLFECAHSIDNSALVQLVCEYLERGTKSMLSHAAIDQFSPEVFKHFLCEVKKWLSEVECFCLIETYLQRRGISGLNGEILDRYSKDELKKINCEDGMFVASCKSDSTLVHELTNLIDFTKFSPRQFYDGPGKSDLLTIHQKYEHLYEIAKKVANMDVDFK